MVVCLLCGPSESDLMCACRQKRVEVQRQKTKVKDAIAEAVAEELASEHCGFYSDSKINAAASPFLSQI